MNYEKLHWLGEKTRTDNIEMHWSGISLNVMFLPSTPLIKNKYRERLSKTAQHILDYLSNVNKFTKWEARSDFLPSSQI